MKSAFHIFSSLTIMKRQKAGLSVAKNKQSVSKGPKSVANENSDNTLKISLGTTGHATREALADSGGSNHSAQVESSDSLVKPETLSSIKGKKSWKQNAKLPSPTAAVGGTEVSQQKSLDPKSTISKQTLSETSIVTKTAQKRQSYSDIVKSNQAAKNALLKLPMVEAIKLTNAEDKPKDSVSNNGYSTFVDEVSTEVTLPSISSLKKKVTLNEVVVESPLPSLAPTDLVSDVIGVSDRNSHNSPIQSLLNKKPRGNKLANKSEGTPPNQPAGKKPPAAAKENTTEETKPNSIETSRNPSKTKRERSPLSVRSAESKEPFKKALNPNTSPVSDEIALSTDATVPSIRTSSEAESFKSGEEISAYDTAEEWDKLDSNENSLADDSVGDPATCRKIEDSVGIIAVDKSINSVSLSIGEGINQTSSTSITDECTTPMKTENFDELETIKSSVFVENLQPTLAPSPVEPRCEAEEKCPVRPAIVAGSDTTTEYDNTAIPSSSFDSAMPPPDLTLKNISKIRPISLNFHTLPRLGSNDSVESDNFHHLRRNESMSSLRDHSGSQGGGSRRDTSRIHRIVTVPRIITTHFSHVTSIERETTINDLKNSMNQLPEHVQESVRQNLNTIEHYPALLPLSDTWCMFISRSPIQTNKKTSMHRKGFEDSQIVLFESSSVFDLCGYWKTYKSIVNSDGYGPRVLFGGMRQDKEVIASIYGLNRHGDNLLFFRKHIRPAWEDPWNAEGGSIRLSEMTSIVFETVFEDLILGAAGMSLECDTKTRLETLGYSHSEPKDLGIIAGIYASRRKVKGSAASGRMASPGPDLFRVGIWVSGSSGPFSPVPDKWASALFTVVQNYLNLSPGKAKFTPYTKHR